MRLIYIDTLITDLEYDIELDARQLDDIDFIGINRELIQFDKDCKQNIINFLQHIPQLEIIYCKDCKFYYFPNKNQKLEEQICTCTRYNVPRDPNDYCSRSKKKEINE